MKFLLILASLVALAASASYDQQWNDYRLKFNKSFSQRRGRAFNEEQFRKKVFISTLKQIEAHNKRYEQGLESFAMGVNQFSDWTTEEIRASRPLMKEPASPKVTQRSLDGDVPESHIWDTSALPVRDQNPCGSCTIFTAIGTVESHYLLFKNKTFDLSEQEVVDCGAPRDICENGWMPTPAFDYLKKEGVGHEKDNPYVRERTGRCSKTSRAEVNVARVVTVPPGEETIKEALFKFGPLGIILYADDEFSDYRTGIYETKTCSNITDSRVNHAMVLVGYGSENGTDYWLIRNSWDTWWGENGYMKLRRGKNTCNFGKFESHYVEIV